LAAAVQSHRSARRVAEPSDSQHHLLLARSPRRNAPALFADRDGTLIEDRFYLQDPDGVHLMPGASDALRRFRDAGHALVLITNQSGIGRGYFGWDAYEAVAARFRALMAAQGVAFDAEAVCGHAPDQPCDWRKPAPGMILAAAAALDLDLPASTLVGDRLGDVQAGLAAGVGRLAHVATGEGVAGRQSVIDSKLKVELLDDMSGLRL
jgi:D-glycero-D-manno-heptose 1,7-bisphosphate phosphatase